ncbi:hypothetical protein [Nocardia colli]|uniref:hypothetical protein n=1 Tax=Nocardia colli TaxID=2545717 RepID=UPI0035E2251F
MPEPVRLAGAVVDIAVPARSCVPGVSMAGFRGRADRPAELSLIPYPAFTVFLDFGDVWLGDDARGAGEQGSGVIGLAPVGVRGCGREVDLLQIRLSPLVAHAALGGSAEVGGTVVALEDLWVGTPDGSGSGCMPPSRGTSGSRSRRRYSRDDGRQVGRSTRRSPSPGSESC